HQPSTSTNPSLSALDNTTLLARLDRIEDALRQLLDQKATKEWYTTDEVAEVLGKAAFTVREWCRNGRINAEKRLCGRGPSSEWAISHVELLRLQNHGLLPVPTYKHVR